MKRKVSAILAVLLAFTGLALATGGFKDVKSSQWFYTYVMKASQLGIVDGYADGTFRPNDDVTRAQLSKILVEYDNRVNNLIVKSSADEQKVINSIAKVIPSTVFVDTGNQVGSGFFIRSNYILTNQHVVGSDINVKVKLANGEIVDGVVTTSDQYKDIALIKVNKSFPYLKLNTSITVGQTAIAIGHPFGMNNAASKGIVSALNISVIKASKMFQMDTPINFGNSGGAVININGEVIGMTTAKYTGFEEDFAEGLSYAITAGELQKYITANIK